MAVPTSEPGSITRCLNELRVGDDEAAGKLWEHFFIPLVREACRALRAAPRRVADEEDVALSALDTFIRRVQQGQFPRLHGRGELWRLLLTITERKAFAQMRNLGRQKRGANRVRGDSAMQRPYDAYKSPGFDQLPGVQPTPDMAAVMAESLENLLSVLTDDQRRVALLKLEGCTNQEIADQIQRSLATVERRLKVIREKWTSPEFSS